ncbi:Hypothetical predicted protein [Mytilus galloprovincialis]|uniref:Uncharacterized protein n=1 Tax=Mytilus galloprovincialis TaxID=29158 RepID=A0A8B6F409_MYTGA|nr:Hypothetical predicted protein [Mytilus galloprovincialis]
MSKNNSKKRKDRNSSGSGTDSKHNKQSKQSRRRELTEYIHDSDISVSEILNHTNSILYNSDDDLESSIFSETSKPNHNPTKKHSETKMASDAKNVNKNKDPTVSEKLDTIVNAIQDLKTNQEGMKRMFESKLDKLRTDLMANVDNKIRALRDELSVDIGSETRRTDQLLITVQSLQTRLEGIEEHNNTQSAFNGIGVLNPVNPLDNPEITITASGIPVTESEDLLYKTENLIRALGEDVFSYVHVTAATRLPNRFDDRPGIVKFSLRNKDEKVKVLRNKMKLKDNEIYKNVYIKSSKSRVERIIEMNARAVLRNLPQGKSFRVDANGRITPKNNQLPSTENQQNENENPHP